jgi:ribosomal protein L11 methylase PrmA
MLSAIIVLDRSNKYAMNTGIVVQIRFPGNDPVNIPANLCAGIPWHILNGPPGTLTLVTREPATRWDVCLRELQNHVCQCFPRESHNKTEWEVMPIERYNFLRGGEPVRLGRSWIAASPDSLISHTRTLKRHMASKRKIIFLTPGWAFGDGCHPSTQGSVNALQYLCEQNLVRGRDVLDIGTGTGILGIIAGKMGARSVLCLDIDSEAIRVARENIRQNGLEAIVSVTHGNVHDLPPEKWTLALANLTISVMIRIFGATVKSLKAPGVMLMSGFKSTNRGEIAKLIQPHGFEVIWSEEQDGWVTSIVRQVQKPLNYHADALHR